MATARQQWFAEVLQAGLDTKVLTEQDILAHATPSVLTSALPRDVMVRVIDATLASGTMSHKIIVEVITLPQLAQKVPAEVVWACLSGAAERSGIRDGIPKDESSAREFMWRALASALDTGFLTAKDLIGHVNAQVLGASLPEALTAKLLDATLVAGKMNPEIIIETLGVDALAKYVSTKNVWAAFVQPGEARDSTSGSITATAQPRSDKKSMPPPVRGGAAPRVEFVDDEVGNVVVELEGFEPDPKPAGRLEVKGDTKPAPKHDPKATPGPSPAKPART